MFSHSGKEKMTDGGIEILRYSQNFIRSPKIVRNLLDSSSIGPSDTVYEIGPGKGIITEQLARRSAKVVAIEKDERLYNELRQKFAGVGNVEIRLGDFLECDLPGKRYKVFSNIPFNLTADIITKLTSAENPPDDAYLIVQKEAARRFMGFPKETQYALLLKPWFELRIVQEMRRTDFQPIPQVDAVLLQIKRRENPEVLDEQRQDYRDFVIYGFNQWKPTLKEALVKIFTHKQFVGLAHDLGFEISAKPTDLTFEQWLGLFNYFLVGVEESKKELIHGAERRLRKQQVRLQKDHRTRIKRGKGRRN